MNKNDHLVDALASMLQNAVACGASRFCYTVTFSEIVSELDSDPALALAVLLSSGFSPVHDTAGLWQSSRGAAGARELSTIFDVSNLVDVLDLLDPV